MAQLAITPRGDFEKTVAGLAGARMAYFSDIRGPISFQPVMGPCWVTTNSGSLSLISPIRSNTAVFV